MKNYFLQLYSIYPFGVNLFSYIRVQKPNPKVCAICKSTMVKPFDSNKIQISAPVQVKPKSEFDLILDNAKYFIIKSNNMENIKIARDNCEWATTVVNQKKLIDAFEQSPNVLLLFSVNKSSKFQGLAKMITTIMQQTSQAWKDKETIRFGGVFKIKWLRFSEVAFSKVGHLKNPLNENEPIKKSRDTQELPIDIGRQICQLFDMVEMPMPLIDPNQYSEPIFQPYEYVSPHMKFLQQHQIQQEQQQQQQQQQYQQIQQQPLMYSQQQMQYQSQQSQQQSNQIPQSQNVYHIQQEQYKDVQQQQQYQMNLSQNQQNQAKIQNQIQSQQNEQNSPSLSFQNNDSNDYQNEKISDNDIFDLYDDIDFVNNKEDEQKKKEEQNNHLFSKQQKVPQKTSFVPQETFQNVQDSEMNQNNDPQQNQKDNLQPVTTIQPICQVTIPPAKSIFETLKIETIANPLQNIIVPTSEDQQKYSEQIQAQQFKMQQMELYYQQMMWQQQQMMSSNPLLQWQQPKSSFFDLSTKIEDKKQKKHKKSNKKSRSRSRSKSFERYKKKKQRS